MTVQINSFDICVPGFERLRSRREFILTCEIDGATTFADVAEMLVADLQSCERPAGFDYAGARAAILDYLGADYTGCCPGDAIAPGLTEPCTLFLYCEQTAPAPADDEPTCPEGRTASEPCTCILHTLAGSHDEPAGPHFGPMRDAYLSGAVYVPRSYASRARWRSR